MARILDGRLRCTSMHTNMAQIDTVRAADVVSPAPGAPRRGAILVVEDRDDVRQAMAQLLELHGFVVVDAADAERALAHLKTDPPGFALILLDLTMPGPVTGLDLRARQLSLPELAAIPTLIVSGSEVHPGVREQLRADGWIAKPFRFDELLALVKQYVQPEAGALVVE